MSKRSPDVSDHAHIGLEAYIAEVLPQGPQFDRLTAWLLASGNS
jgi:hypothetical protein